MADRYTSEGWVEAGMNLPSVSPRAKAPTESNVKGVLVRAGERVRREGKSVRVMVNVRKIWKAGSETM